MRENLPRRKTTPRSYWLIIRMPGMMNPISKMKMITRIARPIKLLFISIAQDVEKYKLAGEFGAF